MIKKEELKKIYDAGGITKIEYEKSIEFLENPKIEKKNKSKKKIFLKKNKPKTKKLFTRKVSDKDEEEITLQKIDELGEIIKFDKSYYTKGMLKQFVGCGKGMKCVGQKASKFMMSNFGKKPAWGQKYPGKMIQSMAMYEVFYASRLYQSKKISKGLRKINTKKVFFQKKKKMRKQLDL